MSSARADAAPDAASAPAVPAGPGRRLVAMVYEGVILFGVVFFFAYGFSALTQFRGEAGALMVAFQVFMFIVLGAYFTGFWSSGRRSLPMKTVWLLVVDARGTPIGVGRAFARYCLAWAMLLAPIALARELSGWFALLLPLPWVWTIVDPQRRALYDVLAGTRLVIVPPPRMTRRR